MFGHSPSADMSSLVAKAMEPALPVRGTAGTSAKIIEFVTPHAKAKPTMPTLTVVPRVVVVEETVAAPVTTWKDAASEILVVGIGGAGCNAVTRMVDQPSINFEGVQFAAVNTDTQSLNAVPCDLKVTLGMKATRGLGAGGNPEVGRVAAEESIIAIEDLVKGKSLVFVTLGLGGGTGSGAAPIVARAARESGAVVIAIVTNPFTFEGSRRTTYASAALTQLREAADTVIVVNNDALLAMSKDKRMNMNLAFSVADQCLQQAVDGIVGIIRHPGLINLDFADVKATLNNGGRGYFGTGKGEGENAASIAMTRALSSHLLGKDGVSGASKVLVYFKGNPKMGLLDCNGAMELLNDTVNEQVYTIFGFGPDETLGDDVEVVLFAVGISDTPPTQPQSIEVKLPRPTVDAASALPIATTVEPLRTPVPVAVTTSVSLPPRAMKIWKKKSVKPQESKPATQSTRVTPTPAELPGFLAGRAHGQIIVSSYTLTGNEHSTFTPDDLDVPAFLRRRPRA